MIVQSCPPKEQVYRDAINLCRDDLVEKYNMPFDAIRRMMCEYGLNYINRRLDKYPMVLTEAQEDLVIGTLLGDGSIHKGGNFRFGQSLAHKGYVEHVAKIMKPFAGEIAQRPTNMGHIACFVDTANHPIFKKLEKQWYVLDDGAKKRRKVIPGSLVLNKQRIAYWAMDDGSNHQSRKCFKFCTNCFTSDEVNFLIDKLTELNGFRFYNRGDGKNDKGEQEHLIHVSMPDYFDFLNYLSDTITLPCMKYKVDTENAPIPDTTYAAKLDQDLSLKIRQLHFYEGFTKAELGRMFNVSFTTIKKIVENKRYIDDDFYKN